MTFSKYQKTIFDTYESSSANLSIIAVAGSGKSTTLQHLVERIPETDIVQVMAFNKDIVTDLKSKMAGHLMTNVSTFNSFGAKILRNNKYSTRLDDEKTNYALEEVLGGRSGDYWRWLNPVRRIVDLLRAYLFFEPSTDDICRVIDEHGIDIPTSQQFLRTVEETFYAALSNESIIDFRDQVFLPIYLDMPFTKSDVTLVDESQDLDRCQAELILRSGRRLVMVGDPDQAIYRFRGAMSGAVDWLESRTSATRLPLSVCYRCPTSIIEKAQKIVPFIEPCDWAPKGEILRIKKDRFASTVADGDLVICRCTAPLVSQCLALIRLGRRAKVKGREIGGSIRDLISLIRSRGKNWDSFADDLATYFRETIARLGNREQQIMSLSDRVDTINALLEDVKPEFLLDKIDSIFTDNPNERGIILMTIHKCKGLEANNVFILAPDLLPHPRAKSPEARKDEKNLEYVAITRVKFLPNAPGRLIYVEDK